MAQAVPLRERTRQAVRSELVRCAMDLFAVSGYEGTTVAQVARSAGMSERSFFRYFGSKEELTLASQEQIGRRLAEALADRPGTEPPWLALRRAFDPIVTAIDDSDGRARRLIEMLHSKPELRGGQLSRQYEWAMRLAPHVAAHLPDADPDLDPEPRSAAIAGAAVMCYQMAQTAWINADGSVPMSGLLDQAMNAVADIAGTASPRAAENSSV
jgi:AcrR family transcriptional regulator